MKKPDSSNNKSPASEEPVCTFSTSKSGLFENYFLLVAFTFSWASLVLVLRDVMIAKANFLSLSFSFQIYLNNQKL